MKKLKIFFAVTLTMFASVFPVKASLIKDLDLNNATAGSTIVIKSAGTAIDPLGNFDYLIPMFFKSGTGYFRGLTDVIGYTTYEQGDTQIVGTLYDFSSIVTLLAGWELSLDVVTGNTAGNITDVFGLAELSNGSGSVKFDITGQHTAFYDTVGFTNASFEGLLTVVNSANPGVSVPEPTTIAIFSLGLVLMLRRSQSSSLI
mgnify:CR=1 FL=1